MSPPSPKRHTRTVAAAVLFALTFLSGTAPAAGATPDMIVRGTWAWPIDAPRTIVRPYIAPASRYASGHRGIDLRTRPGAPVYAPADGLVHYSGFVVNRPVLSIKHPGGVLSSFEPVVSELQAGKPVRRGDIVGHVAGSIADPDLGAPQSGHCGAPCLHFGVRLHGQYVSPLGYLGGIPRSVLLPTRRLR